MTAKKMAGMTTREVAKALKMSPSTVTLIEQKALAKLRAALGDGDHAVGEAADGKGQGS